MTKRVKVVYQIPIEGVSGITSMIVERQKPEKKEHSILKKIFMNKELDASVIKRMIEINLTAGQMEQIKIGLARGLSDDQLLDVVNSDMDEERMKKIIEFYIMENAK